MATVAAAPSSVAADREEAFVCGTLKSIGWHGLEFHIIVFFNRDQVKVGRIEGTNRRGILFVFSNSGCVPVVDYTVQMIRLLVLAE